MLLATSQTDKLNMLLATSRGRGMQAKMGEDFPLYFQKSATYNQLGNIARKVLPAHVGDSDDAHVYVLGGVPNLTRLVKNNNKYYNKYRECIYTDKPDNTITNLKNNIQRCADTIKEAGASAIFCTLTPLNIKIYNENLLEGGATHKQYYTHDYENMQAQIDHIIHETNKFIQKFNTRRGFATPLLHFAVIRRHGKGKKAYYRHHWEGLEDGLHAGDTTLDKWAKSIKIAINKNRNKDTQTTLTNTPEHNTEDKDAEEEPSPKRPHLDLEVESVETSPMRHHPDPDEDSESDEEKPDKREWKTY